ncbi:MAG TPA: hypothetical protein VFY05_00985 [Candidatus Angelobacter sp.]|nr:hypothetical protein [Candidatus Angelobacter sp.]
MKTIWRIVTINIAGILGAFVGFWLSYRIFWSHRFAHNPAIAVGAWEAITIHNVWFWVLTSTCAALSAYLAWRLPSMAKAVISGIVFAVVGFLAYVLLQIDWHPPGHAVFYMEWRPYSPWLWAATILGCGFGVWLALRKKNA